MEQTIRRSEVEIMAPVGSYESLMAAIQAHADSIYFGVEKLNMRAGSSANFTLDDLARSLPYYDDNLVTAEQYAARIADRQVGIAQRMIS